MAAGPAGPGDAEPGPLRQPLALVGSSGASVATTTMIEPEPGGWTGPRPAVGRRTGSGTSSNPISAPTGTPSTRSQARLP